jgi:hypothetical protein
VRELAKGYGQECRLSLKRIVLLAGDLKEERIRREKNQDI